MPIPTKREPVGEGPPFEACCFCDRRTPFWTELADRTPGQQVACCEPCAEKHEPSEVPTKAAWCADQRQKHPTFAGSPSPWAFTGKKAP